MKQNKAKLSSIGFVSSYPPTSCGLATFTAALRQAFVERRGSSEGLGVVSLVETPVAEPRNEVVYQHVNGDRSSLKSAVEILNTHDVVVIQHEYGIFGGPDGSEVIDLISSLKVPTIVTLHTVLNHPTPSQKTILERLVAIADETIVMSQTALRRLEHRYDFDPMKVQVVPHGAMATLAGPSLANGIRPVVLTWGLIGPGKGLETAIQAFADLKDIRPLPRYIILGKTHPKVQAAQGDSYLDGLKSLAHDLGLDDVVEFDGRYLDLETLALTIRQADIILLPYESTEQVTSGVLVEAVAAGKPVVATSFPHAVEMLATGAGIVVPHSDGVSMSGAVRTLIKAPELASRMAMVARSIGTSLHWPAVAAEYESIATRLTSRTPALAAITGSNHDQPSVANLAKVG
jgi:glycosyltransferase involved in cell wall biosynthesis